MTGLLQIGTRVFPGDVLSTSEELLPGSGAFDDGQNLIATRIGVFKIDKRTHQAVVEPATSVPAQLHEGDYVYGRVTMLKPSMAGVEVLAIEGSDRGITGDTNGTLHVSKIAERYVQDVAREYRLHDVVRARVMETKPSVQLSTQDPRCGAILALCLKCRHNMKKVAKALECPNCGRRDTRNIAPDYGQVRVPATVALQVPQT